MLLTVPIWLIRPTGNWDYSRARKYAQLTTTAPPIHCTTEDLKGFHSIVDGHHRWVAAIIRGDEKIQIEV
jgi:hypothetical protein